VLKEGRYEERVYLRTETLCSAAFPNFRVAAAQVLEGRELA
jgi:hypothetical protein